MKALFLFLAMTALATAGDQTPITVINYSRLPVHATSVALDATLLGGPVVVRRADTGALVPIVHEDARDRIYVSLPPTARLDLIAERTKQWPQVSLAEAKPDGLRNGVVRMLLGKKGWQLGFDADKAALIEDGTLDLWIDNQNRGRIMNSDPRDFGLVHYADIPSGTGRAFISPAGWPTLEFKKRLTGFAKAMTVIETFELPPGLPLLICRVRWQNEGAEPLWVAYVSGGDGVKGRWSKQLMPGPLIERKKSPVQGDLNGSETRAAWVGQLCRISMESPASGCGVGMSTLLPTPGKVGQGSMVWGCSGYGFQCNFIDPIQGQFPFLVKPHETLTNGFAFLCSQNDLSVHRQVTALWQSLQAGKLPALDPPCAVFVGGQAIYPQTVSELAESTNLLALFKTNGPVRQAALRLDFNKHYQSRISVQVASAQDSVKLTARPWGGRKPTITLLQTNRSGDYVVELNQYFTKLEETAFLLETSTTGAGAIKALAIAETLPLAPEPLSPVPDANLTDWAAMFRWKAIPLATEYDLQMAPAPDFANARTIRVSSSQDSPWYLVPDDQLPAPGVWYWRLRGVKNNVLGAWSPTRKFTVNREHTPQPLKRPLTAQAPLFTLEATRVLDYTAFHPEIPSDLAPYVGIIAEGFEAKSMTVTEFARGMEKLPHPIMLRSHWVSLADLEWLCQHVPNFIGMQGGEHLSALYNDSKDGEMRYHHRLVKIMAKYGRIYQEADGTYKDDKWQELMDKQGPFVREYGRYLVLSQKNNIIRRQFYSQSAALGLWLGNLTHQHGAWEDGGFYWQNAGFKELGVCAGERSGVLSTMPRNFWDLVCVMGISRGCGLYSLDGQTLMYSAKAAARDPKGAWPSAIWNEQGETTDTFKRFVAPLIRATVQHQLIPTKEQVLQNVRLAVYNDMKGGGDAKTWPHYVEYGPLFAATYGFGKLGNIDGQLWEFFPNTGRYYFIPVLPQGNFPIAPGVRNVPVSQLQTLAQVKRVFEAAYAAWYEGTALACRVGDTLTILNSHENEDVPETYALPVNAELVQAVSGKVQVHSFVLAKIEDQGKRFWLQANTEYSERNTEISLQCSRKPQWHLTPPSAAKEVRWDEPSKTLFISLSHQGGAVEAVVE